MRRALIVALSAGALVVSLAACSKDEAKAPAAPAAPASPIVGLLGVTATDPPVCEIKSQGVAKAGTVSLFVNNANAQPATFGLVDAAGTAVTLGDATPGQSGGREAKLAAGTYTPQCTVAGAPVTPQGSLVVT